MCYHDRRYLGKRESFQESICKIFDSIFTVAKSDKLVLCIHTLLVQLRPLHRLLSGICLTLQRQESFEDAKDIGTIETIPYVTKGKV